MSRPLCSGLIIATIGLLLAGCGGSQLTALHPFEQPLNHYQNVCFSGEPMVAEDITEQLSDLEAEVIKQLNKLAMFETIMLGTCSDSCVNTINVHAAITHIRKVSGAGRFFGGAFAGKASMTAEVTFSDAATDNILGVYTITGKSGGTGYSGGTESAVSRTAESIVKIIEENYQ